MDNNSYKLVDKKYYSDITILKGFFSDVIFGFGSASLDDNVCRVEVFIVDDNKGRIKGNEEKFKKLVDEIFLDIEGDGVGGKS